MPNRITVHVIDDDDAVRDSLCQLLRLHGYVPRPHASGDAFLAAIGDAPSSAIVLLDLRMPGTGGAGVQAALAPDAPASADADGPRYPIVQQWEQTDLAFLRDRANRLNAEIWVDGELWDPPVPDAHRVESGGRIHHIIDATVGVDDLLRLARASGTITRFSYEPPSLSDIFSEAVTT